MEARRRGVLKGIKVGKIIDLTHLLLIDGILLLCDGTLRGDTRLKDILYIYNISMGMEINILNYSVALRKLKKDFFCESFLSKDRFTIRDKVSMVYLETKRLWD
jgi:hypothetical protein